MASAYPCDIPQVLYSTLQKNDPARRYEHHSHVYTSNITFELYCIYIYIYIYYSYNTLTRDMTKIYARFTRARSARVRVRIFSHIPSNRISIINYR